MVCIGAVFNIVTALLAVYGAYALAGIIVNLLFGDAKVSKAIFVYDENDLWELDIRLLSEKEFFSCLSGRGVIIISPKLLENKEARDRLKYYGNYVQIAVLNDFDCEGKDGTEQIKN